MFQRTAILVACLASTGCASVMNESTHPMMIETKTEAGQLVTGADCKWSNGRASASVKSGVSSLVRRSSEDMEIVCNHPEYSVANARAISRANAGMFGNIIIGGGIGAVIDHNQGTAYTYPTWVQLVYGRALVFDRRDQKDDLQTPPTDSGVALAPVPAPSPAVTAPSARLPQAGTRVTMDDLSGLLPQRP